MANNSDLKLEVVKTYVVIAFGGEYSDYWEKVKAVFSTREAAVKWIEKQPIRYAIVNEMYKTEWQDWHEGRDDVTERIAYPAKTKEFSNWREGECWTYEEGIYYGQPSFELLEFELDEFTWKKSSILEGEE